MLVLLGIVLLIALYIVHFYRMTKKYPKGPLPLPIIGNLHQVNFDTLDVWFDKVAEEYGPIFTVYLPRPNVIITKFELIREALIDNGEAFSGRCPIFPITLFQVVENGGIVFSDGESWRHQRRHSIKILRDFGMGKNIMEEQVLKAIYEFLHQLEVIDDKNNVDFRWPLQLCVSNVIYETLFGYHHEYNDCEKLKQFVNYFDEGVLPLAAYRIVRLSHLFPFLLDIPLLRNFGIKEGEEAARKIVNFIRNEVDVQKAKYNPDVPAETFVQAYFKEMEQDNSYLTYDQLINVTLDLWLAGMETTTSTLRWAVLYLQQNPHIQAKMREEIFSVVGKERSVRMADRNKMPFCHAAVMEALRKASILKTNLNHRTLSDVCVNGIQIPNDTEIIPQIASVLADPRVFKNPETFDPSRFLGEDGKTFKKEALERLIPFGIGKRQCAGESLARTELFLIITNLLQKFQLKESPNQPIADFEALPGPFRKPKHFLVKIVQL